MNGLIPLSDIQQAMYLSNLYKGCGQCFHVAYNLHQDCSFFKIILTDLLELIQAKKYKITKSVFHEQNSS